MVDISQERYAELLSAEDTINTLKRYLTMRNVTVGGNWLDEIIIEYIECLIIARDYYKDLYHEVQ